MHCKTKKEKRINVLPINITRQAAAPKTKKRVLRRNQRSTVAVNPFTNHGINAAQGTPWHKRSTRGRHGINTAQGTPWHKHCTGGRRMNIS